MPSEATIAQVINLGNDFAALKMYAISMTALWVYDYFLTLEDEVAYAWKSKKKLIFVLFLITRYLPVLYLVCLVTSSWTSIYSAKLCRGTVLLEIIYFTLITLFAHIVLTLRVYAITGKNTWIAGGLYGLSILQLGVGVYLCVYTYLNPLQLPSIDLDGYRICLFRAPRFLSVFHTSLSLAFDLTAFVIVLIRTRASKTHRCDSKIPSILDTITRDAAVYFSVIFTSHFLFLIMLVFVRKTLRAMPAFGNAVFVPMMITRLILSLKKVARSPTEYPMAEIPDRLPAAPQELQDALELRYSQGRRVEYIRPLPTRMSLDRRYIR